MIRMIEEKYLLLLIVWISEADQTQTLPNPGAADIGLHNDQYKYSGVSDVT